MPSPTVYINKRATSSSSTSLASSSPSCSGKNADPSRCEKPASNNALEIGLGVGVPVAVILLILSVFIIRNYRKEKKEAMDHDPDFDENGDPTALPDMPAFAADSNPFRGGQKHFAGNGGYPLMEMLNKSSQDVDSMDKRSATADQLRDGFVLPYHNQTGSKASLDHFARQLGDHNSFNHHRRVSEYSSSSVHNQRTANFSERSSPVKSNLNTSSSHLTSVSPDGSPQKRRLDPSSNVAYASHLNQSTTLINYNDSSDLREPFSIKYENEPEPETDSVNAGPAKKGVTSARAYSTNTNVADLSSEIVSIHDSDDDSEDDLYRQAHSSPTRSVLSKRTMDQLKNDTIDDTDMTTANVLSPFDEKFHDAVPKNFSELHETKGTKDRADSDGFIDGAQESDQSFTKKEVKVPRMSAFNMLQNVSDDEDETAASHKEVQMTEEQEIELARMKSVYKVYFDRSNSVKSSADTAPNGTFQADASRPLPNLAADQFKVNSSLSTDTDYDKRKTTTSSIYDIPSESQSQPQQAMNYPNEYHQEQGHHPQNYSQQYQHQYPEDQENYNQNYNDQYYAQQYLPQDSNFHPGYPPQGYGAHPQQQVSPMQESHNQRFYNTSSSRLPNASEFRKLSLQTFTNFEPKPRVASSPTVKQQEYFQNSDTSNGIPVPYSLLSAAMLTTGAPISLQRKYKPAGSFQT